MSITTVMPVTSSVVIGDLSGFNEGDSEVTPSMASPVVATDDGQTEQGEVVTEQLKAEVITESCMMRR